MRWWDTHCHVTDSRFEDLYSLLSRSKEAGVGTVIVPSTDLEDAKKALVLSETHNFYFAAGVHPHEATILLSETLDDFDRIFSHQQCVAVGEIGLDYHYAGIEEATQKKVFIQMMELASSMALPVILHTREAEADVLAVVTQFPSIRGVCHSYTGDVSLLRKYLDAGYDVSFNGMLTFKGSETVRELARFAPLDRILLETDAPYLAPTPYRGKINEPAYIPLIAKSLAEIKSIPLDTIASQTSNNAAHLFSRVP